MAAKNDEITTLTQDKTHAESQLVEESKHLEALSAQFEETKKNLSQSQAVSTEYQQSLATLMD